MGARISHLKPPKCHIMQTKNMFADFRVLCILKYEALKHDSRHYDRMAPILSQNGDPSVLNVGEAMNAREKESTRHSKHKDNEKDDTQMPSKA